MVKCCVAMPGWAAGWAYTTGTASAAPESRVGRVR
jgi:hypothetical protein